ncbi:endocuticle structural glycoprotein SgAbd-1 [Schistocerca serialis cubense]|uniref:endocuticle structural glycoprotein SgAbd-1 n=1 Tax=Schistocerca serialis cubense TaxID=2023355 RepID=UPI00214E30FF|nr:endocuticle structural glycoprotein SgAbd-1 [Schistocerca serialis cubense]
MNTLVLVALTVLCGAAVARPQVPVFDPFPKYNPIDVRIPRPSATPARPSPPASRAPPPPPPPRPVVPSQPLPAPAPQPAFVPARTIPQASSEGHWIIIKQAKDQGNDGSYRWNYETENGIAAEETGALKAIAPNEDGTAAQGFYSYTAPDGTPIRVTYTADENGFQAQGDHFPVAPPIPEAIQRALAWNAAHPEEEVETPARRA